MAASSRFVEISQELLDNLLDNSILEKTKRATKYGMKIFDGKFSRYRENESYRAWRFVSFYS